MTRHHDKAQAWFVLMRDPELAQQNRAHFQSWLNSDAKNREAYEDAEYLWQQLDGLSETDAGRALIQDIDLPLKHQTPLLPYLTSWVKTILSPISNIISNKAIHDSPLEVRIKFRLGATVTACTVITLLCATIFFSLKHLHTPTILLHTAHGEVLEHTLEDGTIVTLTPMSSLEVDLTPSKRRAHIVRGKVFFNVATDKDRPFYADSDKLSVMVTGTIFSVETSTEYPDTVRVSEGHVVVSQPAKQALERNTPSQALTAGQEISSLPEEGLSSIQKSIAIEYDNWQKGIIVLRNVSLAYAVASINRYTDIKMMIRSEGISELPVSLAINLDNLHDVPDIIESLLPVTAVKDDEGNISFIRQRIDHQY